MQKANRRSLMTKPHSMKQESVICSLLFLFLSQLPRCIAEKARFVQVTDFNTRCAKNSQLLLTLQIEEDKVNRDNDYLTVQFQTAQELRQVSALLCTRTWWTRFATALPFELSAVLHSVSALLPVLLAPGWPACVDADSFGSLNSQRVFASRLCRGSLMRSMKSQTSFMR